MSSTLAVRFPKDRRFSADAVSRAIAAMLREGILTRLKDGRLSRGWVEFKRRNRTRKTIAPEDRAAA